MAPRMAPSNRYPPASELRTASAEVACAIRVGGGAYELNGSDSASRRKRSTEVGRSVADWPPAPTTGHAPESEREIVPVTWLTARIDAVQLTDPDLSRTKAREMIGCASEEATGAAARRGRTPSRRSSPACRSSECATGLAVTRQTFLVEGNPCHNLEVERVGTAHPSEIIVVGAHYDSAFGTPGANDNGSGVASLLALARRLRNHQPARTLRLVWFANEEPPHFQGADMGSVRYADRARQRGENIVAMLSLETLGYYSDEPGSQEYPGVLQAAYPDTGNFIAFVGDTDSRALVHRVLAAFRALTTFPSEGAALPDALPGVGWSDHWAFWRHGYPAVMVTDTAPFRYTHYHTTKDTPDRLDYARLARVVHGIDHVVRELIANGAEM